MVKGYYFKMNNLRQILLFSIFISSILFSQEEQSRTGDLDSLRENSGINFYQMNVLKRDWSFFNYPLLPYSTDGYYYGSFFPSTIGMVNSPSHNFTASKEEMLAQFRSQQNWGGNKKFSTFTEYLGYAQFLGAIGLLGVHISQWSNLKNAPATTPGKAFNRYDFKK